MASWLHHNSDNPETLRRAVAKANEAEDKARALYQRESARSASLTAELKECKRAAAASQHDLERAQRELLQLRQGRDAAAAALAENEAYVRKLEAKVTGPGNFLVEQNTRLRAVAAEHKERGDAAQALVEQQRGELQRALREIEVLTAALELRADELELDGSLRSGLLYEVAAQRAAAAAGAEAVARCERDAAALREELREARAAAARLGGDADSAAGRAARLGGEVEGARASAAAAEARAATLEHERDVSLDFVAEQAGRLSEALLRAEAGERRARELERAAADAAAARAAA